MYKAIIIGGSAGSFQVITRILYSINETFNLPIFLCLHRLKQVRTGFVEALSLRSNISIVEPNDKDRIKKGVVYLAPANYHMYIEYGNCIALSTEEPVNYSRPSIDILMESASNIYREKLVGIILSGANRDGAYGLKRIKDNGGMAIVQDPDECTIKTMTEASMKITEVDHVLYTNQIIDFINNLS